MRRRTSRSGVAFAVVIVALPSAASGDGLPVLGVDVGSTGVLTADGLARYVTLPAGRQTVVARTTIRGGSVLGSRPLAGRLTIPAVAYDRSASGISADGTTLALIEPRQAFPRRNTRLVVLDARRLRLRRTITLRGDFSFDAISPNGRWLYLINYISARDPNRYRVRAYDMNRGRLLPRPIVDAASPDEQMRGLPITRSMSRTGRWAYTLYDGGGKTPFVHALDTATKTAHCIDLPMVAATDINRLKLDVRAGGTSVRVMRGLRLVATIDTRTFSASAAALAPNEGPAPPWPSIVAVGGLGAVAAAGFATILTVRRRRAGSLQM